MSGLRLRAPTLLPGLLTGLFGAAPAHAINTSFTTYDGFTETVDAFRLVAMIFADPRYETLVVIVATVGISLGAVIASIRGTALNIVAFGFQMLVGIGLFAGMVATTGAVTVYDPVRNATQAVGSVPNLLVLVAGTTNLMERALVDVIDDNTLDPTSKIAFGAGGHAFDLFFNAVSPQSPMTDSFLDATLKDYVRRCYPVARVSPAYGVDDDRLFRTATDLPTAFAAMAGPSTYATVYSSADKGGTTMSCSDAWQQIQTRLGDPGIFEAYQRQLCARTGFAIANAGQLARCKAQIGELGEMMLGTPLSTQAFLTDLLLGNTVGDVLFEDSPAAAARVMANRAMISSGLSTLSVANEWMPTIRSTVFAIMLFMVPIALLFILTPINLRVASFALGLFVFVALWGVIDAGIYQLTLGRAMGALGEMRSNALAANAWLLAPSAAQKALAIFGSFRTAAAGLAGAFVFTVFRFSGNAFSAFTGGSAAELGQAAGSAAPLATSEGRASALEAQASALGTATRRGASSSFGDFGERSSFSGNRAFGSAGAIIGEVSPGMPGSAALGMGRIDAAREMGDLAPALHNGDLTDPATQRAVRANATTAAIRKFAETDALRDLGTTYFGGGEAGERAFAAFAQHMVQWKAFGDENAHAMMLDTASRHFGSRGYDPASARLKAANVIADAAADPMMGKLVANAFDQHRMLTNDLTGAQTQVGAMEGRRAFAGDAVTATERGNVTTEQAHRTGSNQGDRQAAAMLGLSVAETSRRIGFITALSGEARSTAVTRLARATGRDEAAVERAVTLYGTSTQLGTADGASREAAREGTTLYARTREAAEYDVAERAGKLDAQREVGFDGTRQSARTGEQRRQAENAGFAAGADASNAGVREAAHLDAFLHAVQSIAGNRVDIADGGPAGVADRARNARTGEIVANERLTRMQGLLRAHGVEMNRKQLAMAQNGDLTLNLTPRAARQLHSGGLVNDSQYGAIAHGGHARFSFAANDMLVSSAAGFEQSGSNDTSTRYEAGQQAGPDTVERMLGGGREGHDAMARWLKGGFEIDRRGEWRLEPQVADSLERDLQAMMAQTGWDRSIGRDATDAASMGTTISASIQASARAPRGRSAASLGLVDGSVGFTSTDVGQTAETASARLDVLNYHVRDAIASAEKAASHASDPERTFTEVLSTQMLGEQGLRNHYLRDAASARGVVDVTAPVTSAEQTSILNSGRFTDDLAHGPFDGDPRYKER